MPLISQIAAGRHESLTIFGDDYDTRDGTGERDYVHVVDLARAHVEALNHTLARTGCEAFNIGTSRGATVMEILAAFERASGIAIPRKAGSRRPGDVPSYFANPARANEILGWRATRGIDDMCRSASAWQSANPNGYG